MNKPPLPENLAFSYVNINTIDGYRLFAGELGLLPSTAHHGRVLDFTAGRAAAHRAMEMLDLTPKAVLKGSHKEPLWPAGLTGSISHSQEMAVAVVGHKMNFAVVGVDIEPITRDIEHESGFIKMVCTSKEARQVAQIEGGEKRRLALLKIFSMKEAIFKGFFPHRGEWFSFKAVSLSECKTADLCTVTLFTATLLEEMAPSYPVGFSFNIWCHNWNGHFLSLVSL